MVYQCNLLLVSVLPVLFEPYRYSVVVFKVHVLTELNNSFISVLNVNVR